MKIRALTFTPTITDRQIAATSILLSDILHILEASGNSIVEVAHSSASDADRSIHGVLIQKGLRILGIMPKEGVDVKWDTRQEDRIAAQDGLFHSTEEYFINSSRYKFLLIYPSKDSIKLNKDRESHANLDHEAGIVTVTIPPNGDPLNYKTVERICEFYKANNQLDQDPGRF